MVSIGEAARMTGMTVRTLRFYEEKGLVCPVRTESGYRCYDDTALRRLEQVLLLREMDFAVEDIVRLLDTPNINMRDAYARQRALLCLKRDRLSGLIALIDARAKGETHMSFEPFSQQPMEKAREEYRAEAEARWGHTEAYRQSGERAAGRGKADQARVQHESEEIFRAFAAHAGDAPTSEEARALVERWRAHLNRYHYTCTDEILLGLADMYDQDERFAAYLNGFGEGTATFMSRAIRAVAAR